MTLWLERIISSFVIEISTPADICECACVGCVAEWACLCFEIAAGYLAGPFFATLLLAFTRSLCVETQAFIYTLFGVRVCVWGCFTYAHTHTTHTGVLKYESNVHFIRVIYAVRHFKRGAGASFALDPGRKLMELHSRGRVCCVKIMFMAGFHSNCWRNASTHALILTNPEQPKDASRFCSIWPIFTPWFPHWVQLFNKWICIRWQ